MVRLSLWIRVDLGYPSVGSVFELTLCLMVSPDQFISLISFMNGARRCSCDPRVLLLLVMQIVLVLFGV